jgi:sulfur-oxidizing protein SoxY
MSVDATASDPIQAASFERRFQAMPISRRKFVQVSLAGAALGAAAVQPARAAFPRQVFEARSPGDAIRAALGGDRLVDSAAVTVAAPDLAESGDMVPVSVATDLADIESITLIADNNPVPLVASFRLAPSVEGFLATRVKLAESCNVVALVKSGGRLHMAGKSVQVVMGGCGSD